MPDVQDEYTAGGGGVVDGGGGGRAGCVCLGAGYSRRGARWCIIAEEAVD